MTNLSNVDINKEDVAYIVSLLSLREKQLKRDLSRLQSQVDHGEITTEMFDNLIIVINEELQQAQLLHDDIMNQINKQVYK